ncbi:HK97 family phage prohead protease [Clostridium tertium]
MNRETSSTRELRQFSNLNIEVRKKEDGTENRTIGGYAVKYNSPTLIVDRWGDKFLEEVSSGAFDDSLKENKQKALWNHDTSKPLGSVKSGTLRFNSDVDGLNYDIDIPNNSWGNDVYESVQRGDVDGSSFGFICLENKWSKVTYEGEEIYKRSIIKADLFEVSPCTFPAYDSSEINCRSFEKLKEEIKKPNNDLEVERLRNKIIQMEGGIINER